MERFAVAVVADAPVRAACLADAVMSKSTGASTNNAREGYSSPTRAVVALFALLALGACNDAITLEIASDRPVPSAIDAICVAVADSSMSGGHFGRAYRLDDALDHLPQTLRIDPGDADGAFAWVRADRGGVPALLATANVDFGSDVTLSLPRCQKGGGGAPNAVGTAAGPADALLAASTGQGGTLAIAVGADGTAAILDARSGALVAGDTPPLPAGTPVALVAADIDGDCDDDLIVATTMAAPVIWIREGATFTAGASIGESPVAALAAADVDRDTDVDLVIGGGNMLALYLNNGAGAFTADPSKLSAGSRASAISALALGDLDGDGNADLVVGQAGPPLVAWLGAGGNFSPADAVVPPVPLDVASLTLADSDGDYDPDLAVAVRGAPMRLYVDRDGRLEDQSYVRLPRPIATDVRAVAFGGWDAGCAPDAILATADGAPTLSGLDEGGFAAETTTTPASATGVVFVDLDDDGHLDALVSTNEGVRWLVR
ncbi:MAG: VCBS repeat-containing protein [Kofleriaceae bacterium]|nr:VCBS repeat-containing protein [Kofleriaceae bacterium]